MRKWMITSEEELYKIIGCDRNKFLLIQMIKSSYYGSPIVIKKKNGLRKIYSPNRLHDLYSIQKKLLQGFLNNIRVSPVTYGFVKKSCYYDFLEPHMDFYKQNYYLRLDIKDFFDSISGEMIRAAFDYYCDIEDKTEKANTLNVLAEILTYEDRVVQGTITAPVVSNIVFRSMDIRIERYCSKYHVRYTRYADDLLFSSESEKLVKKNFIRGIAKILRSGGFELNYSKVIRSKSYISLNGFVISDTVTLSRKKLSEINRVLFFLKYKSNIKKVKDGDLSDLNQKIIAETAAESQRFENNYALINYLNGYRAFLISMYKKNSDIKIGRIINEIEEIVAYLLKP